MLNISDLMKRVRTFQIQSEPEDIPGRPLRAYSKNGNFFDMSTETVVGDKINNFKGWKCGAGSENIFVDMDGEIHVASCRQGGRLGHIDEDLKTLDEWIECTRELCTCGADLFIPKHKDESDKKFLSKTLNTPFQGRRIADRDSRKYQMVAIERLHSADIPQVYWELGRFCNYDCSYCWPFIHNKTDPHKSLFRLLRGTLLIEEKFLQGRKGAFVISGGEPTLNPALMDWVKYLYSMGHQISMHSNGSRLPKYYKELIKYTNLNISVHFEFYKPEKLIKVIEEITQEKIRTENKNVGHLEIKLMMNPGDIGKALDFEKSLLAIDQFKNFSTYAVVPIRDGSRGDMIKSGYTEEEIQMFGDR